MHLIALKAIANEGSKDDQQITILELEGDPLNLETSGAFDLEIEVMIASDQIQKPCTNKEIEHMVSDTGVTERKKAHAVKHNIKWKHLDCALNLSRPCTGPDCNTYLGAIYAECPHSSYKNYRKGD